MKKKTRPFGVVDGGVPDKFDEAARQDLIMRLLWTSVLSDDPEKKKSTLDRACELKAAQLSRLSRADIQTLN